LFGCAELDVGRLAAQGRGGDYRGNEPRLFLVAGELRAAISMAPHWVVSAAGSVGVPLVRKVFEFRQATDVPIELFRQPDVIGRVEIGVGYAF
jgi:hypothetical protein